MRTRYSLATLDRTTAGARCARTAPEIVRAVVALALLASLAVLVTVGAF